MRPALLVSTNGRTAPCAGELTDEELMRAYAAGDERAFEHLFRRHAPALTRLFRRKMRSAAVAEDLVQQTFLNLHRARHDFRADGRLRPFLFSIGWNLLRDHARRRDARPEVAAGSWIELAAAPFPHATAEETALEKERAALVHAALGRLPERHRRTLLARFEGDKTLAEIARQDGSTHEAVRVRAHRAYARLRELLEPIARHA